MSLRVRGTNTPSILGGPYLVFHLFLFGFAMKSDKSSDKETPLTSEKSAAEHTHTSKHTRATEKVSLRKRDIVAAVIITFLTVLFLNVNQKPKPEQTEAPAAQSEIIEPHDQ